MIFKRLIIWLSILGVGGMGIGIYYGVPNKKSIPEKSKKPNIPSNDKENESISDKDNLSKQKDNVAEVKLTLISLSE